MITSSDLSLLSSLPLVTEYVATGPLTPPPAPKIPHTHPSSSPPPDEHPFTDPDNLDQAHEALKAFAASRFLDFEMDEQFPSPPNTGNPTRLPPSPPSASSSAPNITTTQAAGIYYSDGRTAITLGDSNENNNRSSNSITSSSLSSGPQWGTPPTSGSSFLDQPQHHYSYPPTQIRSRSNTISYPHEQKYTGYKDYNAQPRVGPQFPNIDLHSSQFQFPVNNSLAPLQQLSPAQQLHPAYHTPTQYHDFSYPGLSSFHPPATQVVPSSQAVKLEPWETSLQPGFPFPRMSVQQQQQQQQQQQHSYQHLQLHQQPLRSMSYSDVPMSTHAFPSETRLHLNDPMRQPEMNISMEDGQAANPYKAEEFTEDDIQILKSLLGSGEKVKWRHISSRLSSLTGRRATSTTCSKKTKELFKLPSDKASGTLGTSLAYVVHNSWDEIKEDDYP